MLVAGAERPGPGLCPRPAFRPRCRYLQAGNDPGRGADPGAKAHPHPHALFPARRTPAIRHCPGRACAACRWISCCPNIAITRSWIGRCGRICASSSISPPISISRRLPFDHSKLCTMDGDWCLIGSSNWDARSFRLNFEFDLECYDGGLPAALDRWIDKKISGARKLDAASLTAPVWQRLRMAPCGCFCPTFESNTDRAQAMFWGKLGCGFAGRQRHCRE